MGNPMPRAATSTKPQATVNQSTDQGSQEQAIEVKAIEVSVNTIDRASTDEMPLFKRVNKFSLEPYAWIFKANEGDDSIQSAANQNLKPLTYAGLRDLKLTNEYGKFPTMDLELSDPEYNHTGTKTDLITRLKVGELVSVKFGFKSSHTMWKNLKIIEAQVSFEEGTAKIKIKAIAGYKLKDTTSSDMYTKNSGGGAALEAAIRSLGMEVNTANLLNSEYDELLKTPNAFNANGIRNSRHLKGLEYYIEPSLGMMRIETPFKYELIKKGDKPMKLTYGYPISSIASLEYKKEYPKQGGSNTGGKLSNIQEVRGLDVKNRTFTSYIRGLFKINGLPEGQAPVFFDIYAPIEDQAKLSYPIAQGYSYEEVLDFVSEVKGYVNIKKTVKISGDQVIEGEPTRVRADALKAKLAGLAQDVHYEFNPSAFIYSPSSDANPPNPLTVDYIINNTYIEVREYTFTEAPAEPAKPSNKEKPSSTKATVEATGEIQYWEDNINSAVLIPPGQEDQTKIKDTSSEAYKAHERIKELEAKAKEAPDRYRVSRGKSDGQSYVLLQELKTTDSPENGNQANKETQEGSPIDDAVGGDGTGLADGKPKSIEEKPTPSARAKRSAPKEELTIKFKAGDWTMRVGRVIEIVDLYKTVNGFYYIHKETHSVNTQGFHTEVVCRRARNADLNKYGLGKIKPLQGTSKPKSGEQVEKSQAQEAPLNVTTPAEIYQIKRNRELERRYKLDMDTPFRNKLL